MQFRSFSSALSSFLDRVIGKKQVSLTSIKRLSSRKIRQDYFADQMKKDPSLSSDDAIETFDKKRSEAEGAFLKLMIVQLTVTGFLGLALLKTDASFSIFGVSSTDAYKLRDFLLFCHAIIVTMSVVLQQHHHKLEDYLVAGIVSAGKPTEVYPMLMLKYFGPLETFNINVLPYQRHQFHNLATKYFFTTYKIFRFVAALGFMSFTLLIPLVTAISVFKDPSHGWVSYCAAGYWVAVMTFSTISMIIHVVGIPYTDYSYTMKLHDLQNTDPSRHKKVMEEIVRTNRLIEF
ncbi:hypothetical protein HNQ36_003049 [Afipia massiliensis]|uniref:Uncharacterized protein n=1 Tax=Afipia massiliensis TaxID=211460 RepID=A0A840N5G1_9BRAD|nr:hypothetical protein [Afipia massiliensis]MBB5053058.1 hypothetical protein [Afipia massiliensis]